MSDRYEVVITGVGLATPIGIGRELFWNSLVNGQSGIRPIASFDASCLPVRIAGEVPNFDPKDWVKPRKSLKVMARDSTLAVAASELACRDGQLSVGSVDPERIGVILGADRLRNDLGEVADTYRYSFDESGKFSIDHYASEGLLRANPLGMLKVLPNMLASHISILHDARGPNNTLHHAEMSSLLAVAEAARVIERGAADCMLAGAASSRLHPLDWVRSCLTENLSLRADNPAGVSRPFDAERDGQVRGEGAAILLLERREHAEARGATILGRVLGLASTCVRGPQGKPDLETALKRVIDGALADAGLTVDAIGHVNAHGLSTVPDDAQEARALAARFPDTPTIALKSYFGNLGAAGGAVEMAGSLLAFVHGLVPATLNYDHPDRACPVHVVHRQPLAGAAPVAMLVNHTALGQAAAMVVAGA